MKLAAIAWLATATAAAAGGIDQTGQPVTLLFEEGNRAEIALTGLRASISGSAGGVGSGNVYNPSTAFVAGVKRDFGPRLSAALIVDQPYGVALEYPDGDFAFAGTMAEPKSLALTALGRWRFGHGLAVHGGIRVERIGAEVGLAGSGYGPLAGYDWNGDDDWGVGWVAGASWERPELGMRVALTYGSEIRHSLPSEETLFGAEVDTTTEVTMPQSVNLDLQTGINARTLLYGSVRWVDWNGWTVAPPAFDAVAGPLVRFESDAWTYRVGVGRQLSEVLSAAVEVAHETPIDTMLSPLSPYDGFTALSAGARYALPSGLTLAASLGYVWLGEAEVATPLTPEPARFEDNHAVTAQLRVGFSF